MSQIIRDIKYLEGPGRFNKLDPEPIETSPNLRNTVG